MLWREFTSPDYVTFGINSSSSIIKIIINSINPKPKPKPSHFKSKSSNLTQVSRSFIVHKWLKTANGYQKLFGKLWDIVSLKVSIALRSVLELNKIKVLSFKMRSWDRTWFFLNYSKTPELISPLKRATRLLIKTSDENCLKLFLEWSNT